MTDQKQTKSKCDNCEESLPSGCHHIYGDQEGCEVGPRTDLKWKIGLAIWDNLTDRRGIKHELQNCDIDIQAEIIETMGEIAIETIKKESGES